MHLPPRLSLDSTILSSPLYRRSSYRTTPDSSATTTTPPASNSASNPHPDLITDYQTINMSSSSSSSSSSHSMVREKSTPPTSPLLRGRSPYQRDEMQSRMAERGRSKTKRSRTLGRVAILLIVVIILVFVGRDRVCGYAPLFPSQTQQQTNPLPSIAKSVSKRQIGSNPQPARQANTLAEAALFRISMAERNTSGRRHYKLSANKGSGKMRRWIELRSSSKRKKMRRL
jgi:hypothetical protein